MGVRGRKIRVLETGEVYNSLEDCAKALNINPSGISKVLNGHQPHHKGYSFALHGRTDKNIWSTIEQTNKP